MASQQVAADRARLLGALAAAGEAGLTQTDISAGVFTRNRSRAELASLLGFVLNHPHLVTVTNQNRNALCLGDGTVSIYPDNIDYINELTDQLDQLIATTAAIGLKGSREAESMRSWSRQRAAPCNGRRG